jgi:polyisoprenoid-binding protein YceI
MIRRPAGSLLVLATLAVVPSAAAAPRTFVVDAAASQVRVQVGKSGVFGFAGHRHQVAAPALSGEVVADTDNPAAGSVTLTFEAGALAVLPEGEPAGDPPKVEAMMRGPRVLDVARFPSVTFRSRRLSARTLPEGGYAAEVTGDMTIHGVTRELRLPMKVEISGDVLTASGETVLRHDDFGLQPVSVAGVVKVKNEIGVTYRIVARGR